MKGSIIPKHVTSHHLDRQELHELAHREVARVDLSAQGEGALGQETMLLGVSLEIGVAVLAQDRLLMGEVMDDVIQKSLEGVSDGGDGRVGECELQECVGAIEELPVLAIDLGLSTGEAALPMQTEARPVVRWMHVLHARDLVPPRGLGTVERLVGPLEERLELGIVRDQGGDADTDGHAELCPARQGEALLAQALPQTLGEHDSGMRGRVGQKDGELLATDASNQVAASDQLLELRGDTAQHQIPRWMAMGVVDPLEVIEIHDEQRE